MTPSRNQTNKSVSFRFRSGCRSEVEQLGRHTGCGARCSHACRHVVSTTEWPYSVFNMSRTSNPARSVEEEARPSAMSSHTSKDTSGTRLPTRMDSRILARSPSRYAQITACERSEIDQRRFISSVFVLLLNCLFQRVESQYVRARRTRWIGGGVSAYLARCHGRPA